MIPPIYTPVSLHDLKAERLRLLRDDMYGALRNLQNLAKKISKDVGVSPEDPPTERFKLLNALLNEQVPGSGISIQHTISAVRIWHSYLEGLWKNAVDRQNPERPERRKIRTARRTNQWQKRHIKQTEIKEHSTQTKPQLSVLLKPSTKEEG